MRRVFYPLLGMACLFLSSACTPTYQVQMGAVTSFSFHRGSTCREVLRDLGRPHQQLLSKNKGYVTWRYAYQIRSDNQKKLQYQQYSLVFFRGRLENFASKREFSDFTGRGFQGQPICPIPN